MRRFRRLYTALLFIVMAAVLVSGGFMIGWPGAVLGISLLFAAVVMVLRPRSFD